MPPNITPFTISVPDAAIASLKAKLSAASLPNETSFSNDQSYGVGLGDMRRLIERWRDGYDWRAHESRINELLPQFKTPVPVEGFGDVGVHFVHQKSKNPESIPLLFCHGCKANAIGSPDPRGKRLC